jgi:pimeloyl-ACP methyl ester carboxylesterase
MPLAHNDGLRLYYETEGRSDGETVVFVEGFGSGTWMWRWQHAVLAGSFETILWDHRGTGRSDDPNVPATPAGLLTRQAMATWTDLLAMWSPPFAPVPRIERLPTMSDLAADLEAVLDAHGVDAAHVVGASMGGMVALQYALEYYRAKTLSLLCTTPGGREAVHPPREVQERLLRTPSGFSKREEIYHKMGPALSEEFREENPELIDRIVDWRLDGDATRRGELAQAVAAAQFDVGDRLDEIDVPSLVVHGTQDRVVPIENGHVLAEGLPNTEFEVIEGGSHLFFIEEADSVNQHLMQFLSRYGETAR